jgi:hypothetical protein
VERPLDAGPVIITELANPVGHIPEVRPGYVVITKGNLVMLESRLRWTPEIHNDLDQLAEVLAFAQLQDAPGDRFGQDVKQIPDIIRHLMFWFG